MKKFKFRKFFRLIYDEKVDFNNNLNRYSIFVLALGQSFLLTMNNKYS